MLIFDQELLLDNKIQKHSIVAREANKSLLQLQFTQEFSKLCTSKNYKENTPISDLLLPRENKLCKHPMIRVTLTARTTVQATTIT